MGNQAINIVNAERLRRDGFPYGLFHGFDGNLEGFIAAHFDAMQAFGQHAFRRRETRPAARHANQIGEPTIRV